MEKFFCFIRAFCTKISIFFQKSALWGKIFAVFCKFDGFFEKIGKNKKARKRKMHRQAKKHKKHRAKAVFFQVRTQGRLANCPLGICAVRRQSSVLRYFVFEILHCVQNDKLGFVYPTVGAGFHARPSILMLFCGTVKTVPYTHKIQFTG